MRYGWLVAAILLLSSSGLSESAAAAQSDFRVTLIGSGNPVPEADRFGPATLVEAGDQKLLFDAGRGATIRLWQLKIPFSKVSPLFLTHFHSDHTVGIPDLWLTGWLGGPFGRRTTPVPRHRPDRDQGIDDEPGKGLCGGHPHSNSRRALSARGREGDRRRVRSGGCRLREGRRSGDRLRGQPRR